MKVKLSCLLTMLFQENKDPPEESSSIDMRSLNVRHARSRSIKFKLVEIGLNRKFLAVVS